MHCWLQNILGLITPMNYFPKQLLLDFEDAGEISVGKEKEKKYRIRKGGQRKRR